MISGIARPERCSTSTEGARYSGERRLPACIRRQLADEICVRPAAEPRRQAACAPQQNGGTRFCAPHYRRHLIR
jgi:hypothetical protein